MKAENDDSTGNSNLLVNGTALASRKRTIACSDGENRSKIQKLVPEALCRDSSETVNLLSLSDDVLLVIMSYLGAVDLMSLRRSCQRMAQVASDWSLWTRVDFRPSVLFESVLEAYVPLLRDTTEYLAIRGFMSCCIPPIKCLSKELLLEIKRNCTSLKSFIAEEHFFDAYEVKVSHFPSSLKHWSLKGSKIVNLPMSYSYFLDIDQHLPNLQVLELTNCTWVPAHSLMALSKLRHLEEVRLDGCRRLNDCIAYASLAFSMGFKALQVLDLRRTGFSDSELPSINRFNRLTHVYLESENSVGRPQRDADADADANADAHSDEDSSSSDDEWDNVADFRAVSDSGLRQLVNSEKPHHRINSFGHGDNQIVVSAPIKDKVSRCRIHTLVARNFHLVTDATLDEMLTVQTLCYLDLTGCDLSKNAVDSFRASRPEVTLVTSFDNVT